MAQRITKSHVEAKVDIVNRMLGFDPESVTWRSEGAVNLYGAYGSTAVHRYVGESGGTRDLSGLGTLREASIFLSGMIAALRIRDEG